MARRGHKSRKSARSPLMSAIAADHTSRESPTHQAFRPDQLHQGDFLMIRRIAAPLLALHGVIHLIGFVTPWRIATLEGFAYRTTVFNGASDVGDVGARVIGLVWLGLTFGFLAAGYGVWRRARWSVGVTGVLAVVSLIVCVLGLPEAGAGAAIDGVILAGMAYHVFVRDRATSALG